MKTVKNLVLHLLVCGILVRLLMYFGEFGLFSLKGYAAVSLIVLFGLISFINEVSREQG